MAQSKLPEYGRSWGTLREQMKQMAAQDVAWRDGRAAVLVFHPGDEVLEVAHEAYGLFISENGLGPAAFPSLKTMEAEVVAMTKGLLNAPETAAGSMTSGGTESLLLAIKTCRDVAWSAGDRRRHVILTPLTAHPAIDKAAHLFGLQVNRLPIDRDFCADVSAFEDAVAADTLMLIGSAPCFPFGTIDPIDKLGDLALRHDLWLHVDACVGAFLAPFARALGVSLPAFDFSVSGVRSMSGDLHKYGYAAKGASTITYRDAKDFSRQIFDVDVWPSGRMRTPTLAGTRPGGAIASAWAVMNYLGAAGYRERTRMVLDARLRLEAGVRQLGLIVHGHPQLGILNFGAPPGSDVEVLAVADRLREGGWVSSRTLTPPGIQMMLSPFHLNVVDAYLGDLQSAVAAKPRSSGTPAVTYDASS